MVGKMGHVLQTFIIIFTLRTIRAVPVVQNNDRQPKHLSFLDYLPGNVDYNGVDFVSMDLAGDDLSRTVPSRKNARPGMYNSPVYYIRLPPQPYMFVPGLGYVSQPAPSPMSQFVNLPVSFVSNGKPAGIYQWSGTFQDFQTEAPPPAPYPGFHKIPKPTKKPVRPDSTVHRVPGSFTFNGKPHDDIYVLRDSYNSLYSDVLQNVYP